MPQKKSKAPLLLALLIAASFGVTLFTAFEDRSPSGGGFSFGAKVGVVEAFGVIVDSKQFIEDLQSFVADDSIKAIVVRIDSPGGSVGPCQEIYSEIIKARQEKPVVSSMGTVAASGGYYIASATERIFANGGTITGSIGVIMEFVHVGELLRLARVDHTVIKSGEFKDVGSPFRPISPDQKKYLQELVMDVRNQFVSDVVAGRGSAGLSEEEFTELKNTIDGLADGRIFTGRQAVERRLVDAIGTLTDAADFAAKRAGIEEAPQLVYPKRRKMNLLETLMEETASRIADFAQTKGLGGMFFLDDTTWQLR